MENRKNRIAILGGGPSGLFMYKRIVESADTTIAVDIFEKKSSLGMGMPYSREGAGEEHITNVSDNEIPLIVTHFKEWLPQVPKDLLDKYGIKPENFSEYKVFPRLLFGMYLSAQFGMLIEKAHKIGIETTVHLSSEVTDVTDHPDLKETWVEISGKDLLKYTAVIICTGHHWPLKNEGKIPGYYDSPYPPSKLKLQVNHTVAIRGSSLTAIDAIRTLARTNGRFVNESNGLLSYQLSNDTVGFKIKLHSRNGLLPAVRFHLDDSHLSNKSLLTPEQIKQHMQENQGFLSLDFIFEKDFKEILRKKDETFYNKIADHKLEEFVAWMMELRESIEPFHLLKAEYREAEKSIRRHESVYWKETLAQLSFAMNYPAKHFSAEDMQRLHTTLSPLISIVIAFVPQSSCKELMALHDAGILDIVAVGSDNKIEAKTSGGIIYHFKNEHDKARKLHYQTFIDCVGQVHLSYQEFPFKGLLSKKSISPARLKFKSAEQGIKELEKNNKDVTADHTGSYYLNVPGIAINDNFQVIDQYGAYNNRIYMMAIPYMSGFNPDYSGLDFCEEASGKIIKCLI